MIYDPVLEVIHHLSEVFCSNCGHESCKCRNIMNMSTDHREHKSQTTRKTTQWSQSVVSGLSILQTGPVLPTANVWKTWVISKHGASMNRQFSNSIFQVTLRSHTILYLLRVLMFVSFFFTGLMTPRLVHVLGQHTWNTKSLPLRASKSLYDHWKTVEPGNIGTSHSKLLVKLPVLVRVALEVFLVRAPLFLWQSRRHMLRLKQTMVLVFIKTSFIKSRLWDK